MITTFLNRFSKVLCILYNWQIEWGHVYQTLSYLFPADREVQRILLELLNQMDGFDQNVNVKV